MINLSRNSWHYHFACYGNDNYIKPNLCPYVRQVLLGLFKFVLLWGFLAVVAIGDIIGITAIVQTGWNNFLQIPDISRDHAMWFGLWVMLSTTLTVIVAVLVAAVATREGLDTLSRKRYAKKRAAFIAIHGEDAWYNRHNIPVEPREPNIFWEWLKAKHDNLCPRIEFKS